MKKNRFLTVIFSIIPGCGHMYLGYLKKGLEFMTMFMFFAFLGWFFAGALYYGYGTSAIGVFFLLFLPIIWFYQMFDAMYSISQMRRLEIEIPEDDGFFVPGFSNISNTDSLNFFRKPKIVKTIAVILVCIGGYVLFMNISEGIYNMLYNSTYANSHNQILYRTTHDVITRYVPAAAISIGLIIGGIRLLRGNKKKNNDGE
ncbi:MAG: hypothetical protein FWD71_21480 [Oscillospiraceae bacterium]|nr:hypothetical protein [Oscillospiraceae bacterium]